MLQFKKKKKRAFKFYWLAIPLHYALDWLLFMFEM